MYEQPSISDDDVTGNKKMDSVAKYIWRIFLNAVYIDFNYCNTPSD